MADEQEQKDPQGKPEPRAAKPPAENAPAAKPPAAKAPAAKPEKPADDAAETPPAPPGEAAREHHRPAPVLPQGAHYIWGTGRRKKAIARVRIRPGEGKILINKREVDDYFPQDKDRASVVAPLDAARMRRSWDVWVNVGGGGHTGQAGAVMLGLARALAKAMPELESALRDHGLMTRDARVSERKKPGQPGARKRFQFSKR
jgi:small subunit ribosomal protein S9